MNMNVATYELFFFKYSPITVTINHSEIIVVRYLETGVGQLVRQFILQIIFI